MTDQRIDLSILDRVGDQPASSQRLLRDYLASHYVFVKSSLVFELNNSALHNACERIAAVSNQVRAELESAAIEFLADGVYVNRELVKLDVSGFEQGDYLFHIWKTLGIGELDPVADTSSADWLELAAEFKRFVIGQGEGELSQLQLPRIRLSPMSGAAGEEDLAVTDRFRALRAHSIATVALRELIDKARIGGRLRVVTVKRPMQEMIAVCETSAPLMLALAHLKRNKVDVAHHLANTAVLVICIARHLGLSRPVFSELAVQAALHCLGRAFVPATSDSTGFDREVEAAMESVAKLARSGLADSRTLSRVVVANEVRRWVGSEAGFDDYSFATSAAARLIAAAHAYELLTTPAPDHPALLPDEALRVLVAEAGRRYDPTAVRLLVNELGVYPVGSLVALSSGETAIVIEAPRDAAGPERPKVKIIRDAGGVVLDGAILDLAGRAGAELRILRCVDTEEEDVNPPAFLLG